MKKTFLIFILIFSNLCFSQRGCNLTMEDYNTLNCLEGYSGYSSSIYAQTTINQILKKGGIPDINFIVKTCDGTSNASAVFWKDKRFILLDESFLYKLNTNNINWFYLFVLSHEIGHHLYGHTFEATNLANQRLRELQADRFAGFMVRKFGGSLENLKNALVDIPHPKENNTDHPIYIDRYNAASVGYNSAIQEEKEILNRYKATSREEIKNSLKASQIAKARTETFDYYLSGDRNKLENAILLYNQALSNSADDSGLCFDLGILYWYNKDPRNAELYIKKAYSINPYPEYMIQTWALCDESDSKDCSKYNSALLNINAEKISDPEILKHLSRFYSTYSGNQLDHINLNKSVTILNRAIQLFESKKEIKNQEKLTLADLYSDLATVYLRLDKLEESYVKIQKALEIRLKTTNLLNSIKQYSDVDRRNLCDLYSNKALIELRLEKWTECLKSTEEVYRIDDNYKLVEDGTYNYFKARCFHNLNRLEDAIINYTTAIKKERGNHGYLYYYRGFSNYKMGNKQKACMDFQIACDNGINEGCSRFNLICE